MRVDQEVVDRLRRAFGLSGYEAKLYLALLQGARSPREASILSGVPLPRVYDVARLLEAKGLARREPGGWYTPVPPRAAVASLVARMEEELRARVSLASSVAGELESLIDTLREGEASFSLTAPGVASLIAQALREARVAYVTVAPDSNLFINTLRSALKASSLEAVLAVTSRPGGSEPLLEGFDFVEECSDPDHGPVVNSVSTPSSAVFAYEDCSTGSIVGVLVKWQCFTARYYRSLRGLWERCRARKGSR
ncbi:TrmB family transcriptional regulator [Stetteria hydrogenophila]